MIVNKIVDNIMKKSMHNQCIKISTFY